MRAPLVKRRESVYRHLTFRDFVRCDRPCRGRAGLLYTDQWSWIHGST